MAPPLRTTPDHLPRRGREREHRGGRARLARRALLAATAALLLFASGPASSDAGPTLTRFIYAPGEIVPIPAAIPHEEGDMIDSRLVPDLRWIAAHFPIYITDGYSGPLPDGEHVGCHGCHVKHSDHYNGLAVDIVPLHWSDKCDAHWRGVTRLALWAEPRQNHPVPPFRWVGYNGDPGHGCGNHLHLSWEHSPAPQFQLAEWVSVFPVVAGELGRRARPRRKGASSQSHGEPQTSPAPRNAPQGGISQAQTGGVSPHGD